MFKGLWLSTAFLVLFVTSVTAQERAINSDFNSTGDIISKYKERLVSVKVDLSSMAIELGDIIKCYQQQKIYTSSGCSTGTVLDPESDPFKANHANKVIPTSCASDEVQHYSAGAWSCKEIRYLCSNPSGC